MERVSKSRIKNTKRNIVSGLIKQIISILLPFIIRTIIIYTLGTAYSGLNGLFSSILQVLNLTDLGFTAAVTFVMYRPIADGDNESVSAILNFLKKTYFIVGIVILLIGLAITPLLSYLISGEIPSDINIYLLFLIYLFNTVISYLLFAYKGALFNAMQREDVVSNIYSVTSFFIKGIQILLLIFLRNYYVFIMVMPLGTVANNILLQVFSKKYFPEIIPNGKLPKETYRVIIKQVKALFVGKLGTVARNSLDDVMISFFMGLVAVAIYDNYYYIFSAIYGILLVLTQSMQASVGNSIAKETKLKNYKDLLKFNFLFMWIVGWCSITMSCLYQPFMFLWMRGDTNMLLSLLDMFLLCLYFYILNMNNARNLFLEGNGLYHECRLWFVLEAVGNLVLNLLLGYFLGITGIILATIITIFVFNFITRTNVVFKHYFNISPKEFYLKHLLYFLITICVGFVTYHLCDFIRIEGFLNIIIRSLLCVVLPNVLFLAFLFKTKEFKEAKGLVLGLLHNKKN
ncbi:MAG: lipopolysaccharide biosynthesis protein [Bacilli bacterium]|jgi:O-antigen/teichoic acid export membrane protein